VVDELGVALHVHLLENPRPIRADRLDAPLELLGDPANALAATQEAQHLVFAVRKTFVRRLVQAIAERADELLGRSRAHITQALGESADRPDQLLGRRALGHVAGRARDRKSTRLNSSHGSISYAGF